MTKHEPTVSISRDIDASPQELFKHLARPADHSTIDGTGMLRGADGRQVLSGIGDVFEMKMFSEIGEYVIENHVVEFEADRRIAWEPVLKATDNPDFQSDIGRRDHVRWGWEFTPQAGGRTRVTEFYDLSSSPDWLHEATNEGEQWRPAMEASLANLARMIQQAD